MQEDPAGFAAGDVNLCRFTTDAATVDTDPTGLEGSGGLSGPRIGSLWEKINQVLVNGPVVALKAKDLAEQALKLAAARFPQSELHNGKGDAFRHCVWSALMRTRISSGYHLLVAGEVGATFIYRDYAYLIGYLHESLDTDQPHIEYAMDMNNNNIGLSIGDKLGKNASIDDICTECEKALKDGRLIWIKGGKLTGRAKYKLEDKTKWKRCFPDMYGDPQYRDVETDLDGNEIKK